MSPRSVGALWTRYLSLWALPEWAGPPASEGGGHRCEQSYLVPFWQRLRAHFLAVVVVSAFVLAVRGAGPARDQWSIGAPLLVAGLALGLLVDAGLQIRRRSTKPLLSLLLDTSAIAAGFALLQLPVLALVAPFLYSAMTAATLMSTGRAMAVWGYTGLLAAWLLAGPRPPVLPGPSPTGEQLDAAVWLATGLFGLLCLAETLLLTTVTRRHTRARLAHLAHQARHDDEFLAGISHALRTPLTCVIGFGQLIEKDWGHTLPAEVGELLAELNQQADEMRGIVDNLVFRAKDAAGRLTLAAEPTDLRQIASDVIRSVAWLYPKRTIRLAGDPQVVASADHTRTRQVVRNLLSNAIQHGGDLIVLELRSGAEATLTVTDNGSDPVTSDGDLLLPPWERCFPEVASSPLGFGVPVSVRLAELMGGNLTFHHTPGNVTFTLSLPSYPQGPEQQGRGLAPAGIAAERRP